MSQGGPLTFLTGGARSGKSRMAVDMATEWEGPVAMIVTAHAGDEEMAARIELHRAHRPASWTTIDAPEDLERALIDLDAGAFAVVDCLTLWLANILAKGVSDDDVDERARAAVRAAAARSAPVVVVSNEVGSGIVPMNALARRYRDALGRVNAIWSEAADDAYLVVAGRRLRLEAMDGR